MSEYRTDSAFAIVPMWLAESKVGDRALRLYTLLSGMRDYGTDMASVGRKLLAAKLGCSEDTLDRAKAELEKVGAISVERGERENGVRPRNVYTIHRDAPDLQGVAAPVRAAAAGAAMYEKPTTTNNKNLEIPLKEEPRAREASEQLDLAGGSHALGPDEVQQLGEVDGVKLTRVEYETARAVLAAFNAAFETRFSGRYFLRGVVMRLREHPSMTLDDHVALVEKAKRNPWWKDDPTPAVVYGNDHVFERMLNMQDRGADEHDFSRFTKA